MAQAQSRNQTCVRVPVSAVVSLGVSLALVVVTSLYPWRLSSRACLLTLASGRDGEMLAVQGWALLLLAGVLQGSPTA